MGWLTTYCRKLLLQKGYYLIKQNDVPLNPIAYNTEANITAFYNNNVAIKNYIKLVAIPHAKIMLANLLKANINLNGKTVADVGCGTGHFLNEINTNFKLVNCTGYEINEIPLTTAKKLFTTINFDVAGMYKALPNTYDVIFVNHVLEHLPYPEDCITAMLNSLNLNGLLIINVPNGRLDSFGGHIHFFGETSLKLLLLKHTTAKKINCFLSADGSMVCAVVEV